MSRLGRVKDVLDPLAEAERLKAFAAHISVKPSPRRTLTWDVSQWAARFDDTPRRGLRPFDFYGRDWIYVGIAAACVLGWLVQRFYF